MFGNDAFDRRTFVKSAAAVSIFGTALAGCSNGSDGANGAGGDDSGGEEDFEDWMDNVENYEGVVDRTGREEVSVTVGAQGNNGAFAFAPPAIRVDPGTTVTWEWTGDGGSHNVHAVDGATFESDLTDEKGFTFEYTFEDESTVTYQCDPHATLGMKGVVVVE